MKDINARFDDLAAEVQDWADSVLAIDERQCPSELRHELDDLVEECKSLLDEVGAREQDRYLRAVFASAEMAEVVDRYARIRRTLEDAIGPELLELIEEEGGVLDSLEADEAEDEDEEEPDE